MAIERDAVSAVHTNGTEELQGPASVGEPRGRVEHGAAGRGGRPEARGQEGDEGADRRDCGDRRRHKPPLAKLISLVVLMLVVVPVIGCACLTLALVLPRLGG
jgi:hypothetical protein